MKDRFAPRRKAMHSEGDLRSLCEAIRAGMPDLPTLRRAIEEVHPADVADAMRYLSDDEDLAVYRALSTEEAAEVLDEVDAATRRRLVAETPPERLAQIGGALPTDEAADVLGALGIQERDAVLARLPGADGLRELLSYPADTAGGIMTQGFVDVLVGESAADALARFKAKPHVEPIFDLCVVTETGAARRGRPAHAVAGRAERTAGESGGPRGGAGRARHGP